MSPRTGLWLGTACRHCEPPELLHQINPGHADGVRATWVGKCGRCGREYVVTASIAQVKGRGVPTR